VIAVLGDGTYRLDCTAAGARTTAALLRDTIAILERVAAGSDDDGDQ
jgi:hypothetical protein